MSRATVVDLTSSSPNEPSLSNVFTWREGQQDDRSSQIPHSRKRRRLNNGSIRAPSGSPTRAGSSLFANPPSTRTPHGDTNDLEEVDLTGTSDSPKLSKTISKQQEDAVKSQQDQASEPEAVRSTLTAFKCPVCMDTPEDATTTLCGHLFCHKCIIDTLRFGEDRRALEGQNKTPRGNCPVCRKTLSRVDNPGPRRNLVPLQIKLTTRKKS